MCLLNDAIRECILNDITLYLKNGVSGCDDIRISDDELSRVISKFSKEITFQTIFYIEESIKIIKNSDTWFVRNKNRNLRGHFITITNRLSRKRVRVDRKFWKQVQTHDPNSLDFFLSHRIGIEK